MTRRSKREIERSIEEIGTTEDQVDAITDAELGVSAPFVTFEGERPTDDGSPEFIVVETAGDEK